MTLQINPPPRERCSLMCKGLDLRWGMLDELKGHEAIRCLKPDERMEPPASVTLIKELCRNGGFSDARFYK